MAIQMRRGAYGDLDPTKAVNAEVLVVTSNDPIATDGKAVYIAFAPGNVKRMATHDEMGTYETNARMSADAAQQSASSASQSASSASTSASTARQAADEVAEVAEYAEEIAREAAVVESNIAEIREAKTASQTAASNASSSASLASQAASSASNAATAAAGSASSASTSANTAKSWAVGPNGSGTGTDTNNAKYYSQQASASASQAGQQATNAGSNATLAKNWAVGPSGSGDGTDTNNAKYYAGQAASSAQQAASSASSAGASASTAGTKATAADTSALKSEGHAIGKQNGSDVGSTSPYYHNNAKYYADQAAESARTLTIDDTLSQTGQAADAKKVGDALSTKADIDGTYDDMTVGTAKQLLSDTYTEDKVPYLLRPTGGSADVGTREFDSIVGGTVAWNQLAKATWGIQGGGTINSVTDGVYDVSFSDSGGNNQLYSDISLISNHVHIATIMVKIPNTVNELIYVGGSVGDYKRSVLTTDWQKIVNVWKGTAYSYNLLRNNSGGAVEHVLVKEPQVFDLTQMFGTAIADRAYALEQATAGSGIAWLKSMGFFTKDYYEYDAGTLKSVEGLVSHDMVGFNQWDEEWELGALYYATGLPYNASNRIRSKYFTCLPSTTYCWSCNSGLINMIMFEYDSEQNMLSRVVSETNQVSTFTTSDKAAYLRFYFPENYGSTYNHDICINLSDPSKNGTYEPYEKHSYPLDSALTLRGIPKLDSNNQIYYDGDEYAADGTVTRRYGIVDLGTLSWEYETSVTNVHFFSLGVGFPLKPKFEGGLMSDKYIGTTDNYTTLNDKEMCVDNSAATPVLRIKDDSYTSASAFKAAMSGVYLVYELATPTTETAEPYHNPQICDPDGTEEYVTTGIVPVGHDTQYIEGLKAKIEGLPWDLSMIAPIENGTTARKAYTVGQYFLKDDQFCKALTSIASGATFTLNTNYAVTTVAAELYTALNS